MAIRDLFLLTLPNFNQQTDPLEIKLQEKRSCASPVSKTSLVRYESFVKSDKVLDCTLMKNSRIVHRCRITLHSETVCTSARLNRFHCTFITLSSLIQVMRSPCFVSYHIILGNGDFVIYILIEVHV